MGSVYGVNERIGVEGLGLLVSNRCILPRWELNRQLNLDVLVEVHVECPIKRFAAHGDVGMIPEWNREVVRAPQTRATHEMDNTYVSTPNATTAVSNTSVEVERQAHSSRVGENPIIRRSCIPEDGKPSHGEEDDRNYQGDQEHHKGEASQNKWARDGMGGILHQEIL